jgi:hypothetical protein
LRRPTALSSLSPRKELLQTSSARESVLCTFGGSCRAHLVERHTNAAGGRLPGGLAPGQAAADDLHARQGQVLQSAHPADTRSFRCCRRAGARPSS